MDFRACLIQVEELRRQDILTNFFASPCDIHMCSKSDLRELSLRDAFTYRVAHSGSKWLKPAKYKLTWCYIRYYITNFHHSAFIRFTAFSFRVSCIFIFKICPSVTIINMIDQFHEFFNLIFGGFLLFGPTMWLCPTLLVIMKGQFYSSADCIEP